MFEKIPEAMIFGEDVEKIGGVNQDVKVYKRSLRGKSC